MTMLCFLKRRRRMGMLLQAFTGSQRMRESTSQTSASRANVKSTKRSFISLVELQDSYMETTTTGSRGPTAHGPWKDSDGKIAMER
jgi:hypothetical protein